MDLGLTGQADRKELEESAAINSASRPASPSTAARSTTIQTNCARVTPKVRKVA